MKSSHPFYMPPIHIQREFEFHGVFEQRPKGHVVDGCGCAKCSREENSGWTTNDWKRKLKDGRVLKLYYIECWDDLERFYKIGLTCKNKIEDRLKCVIQTKDISYYLDKLYRNISIDATKPNEEDRIYTKEKVESILFLTKNSISN